MQSRLAIAAVIVLVLAVCLVPWQVERGGGSLPLSVAIESASGSPITAVNCEVAWSEEAARYSADNLIPPESHRFSAVADPFDGGPLEVTVPISYTAERALLWASTQRRQAGLLVVIAQHRDGRGEGRVVAIPDLRQARSLRVRLP